MILFAKLDTSSPTSDAMVDSFTANGFSDYEVLTSLPSDLSSYDVVFVLLGVYDNSGYHNLTSTESSYLVTYMDSGGYVYMEGGDTWGYDSQYPAHSYFNIASASDGSSDLSTVSGVDSTIMDGLSYSYVLDHSYVDRITAGVGAIKVWQNLSVSSYGMGVTYDEGSYKTFASSIEFAGLTEGVDPNTKDNMLSIILSFFNYSETASVTTKAYSPTPITGSTDVQYTGLTLDWEFGDNTTHYKLLLDTVNPPVVELTGWTTTGSTSFDVDYLDPYEEYFWRIDSSGLTIVNGDVWDFRTVLPPIIQGDSIIGQTGSTIFPVLHSYDEYPVGYAEPQITYDYSFYYNVGKFEGIGSTIIGSTFIVGPYSPSYLVTYDWDIDYPFEILSGQGTSGITCAIHPGREFDCSGYTKPTNMTLTYDTIANGTSGVTLLDVYCGYGPRWDIIGSSTPIAGSIETYELIPDFDLSGYPPKCSAHYNYRFVIEGGKVDNFYGDNPTIGNILPAAGRNNMANPSVDILWHTPGSGYLCVYSSWSFNIEDEYPSTKSVYIS